MGTLARSSLLVLAVLCAHAEAEMLARYWLLDPVELFANAEVETLAARSRPIPASQSLAGQGESQRA
ncbi:MAG TPA: hypothetical protein VGD98_01335 [Ktedonobacteraceae bacterium]